jgi:hypothetical protein
VYAGGGGVVWCGVVLVMVWCSVRSPFLASVGDHIPLVSFKITENCHIIQKVKEIHVVLITRVFFNPALHFSAFAGIMRDTI